MESTSKLASLEEFDGEVPMPTRKNFVAQLMEDHLGGLRLSFQCWL
jgi:hypothetical protein